MYAILPVPGTTGSIIGYSVLEEQQDGVMKMLCSCLTMSDASKVKAKLVESEKTMTTTSNVHELQVAMEGLIRLVTHTESMSPDERETLVYQARRALDNSRGGV